MKKKIVFTVAVLSLVLLLAGGVSATTQHNVVKVLIDPPGGILTLMGL